MMLRWTDVRSGTGRVDFLAELEAALGDPDLPLLRSFSAVAST
jgi:hypothetical protein